MSTCIPLAYSTIDSLLSQIRNALEEYKTGTFVLKSFEEAEYRPYFITVMDNLITYTQSPSRRPILEEICMDLYLTGK